MSARESYDQERIVRQSEIRDQPTAPVRTVGEVRHEPVVREQIVVDRPVTSYGYAANAVSEDIVFDRVLARRALLDRISNIVWFVAGMIEIALGLRIAFRLLEANQANGFVGFIHDVTEPFVRPFQGIFNDPVSGGAVLDTAALMAMVIVAIVAWAAVRLIWLLLDRPETGIRRSVREVHSDHA